MTASRMEIPGRESANLPARHLAPSGASGDRFWVVRPIPKAR